MLPHDPSTDFLRSESSDDQKAAIAAIEARGDQCHFHQHIHDYPWNQAVWAVMTATVQELEFVRSQIGAYNRHFLNALSELGRVAASNIRWVREHNKSSAASHTKFRSNPALEFAATDIRNLGRSYHAFEASFPAWYADLFRASLVDPNRVRFSNKRQSVGDRRVSAWHKGLRPGPQLQEEVGLGPIKPGPALKRLLNETVDMASSAGPFSINYHIVPGAWEGLTAEYQARLRSQFRRDGEISLGTYTIAEFQGFYAALMAMCSLHEFVHASWATKAGQYPYASAVIVRARVRLVDKLATITQLEPAKVAKMLSDLTFRDYRYDLHVHPFVPVADAERLLAVIPHFPMDSNPEENILRMVTLLREDVYEVTTRSKEEEAIRDLVDGLPQHLIPHDSIALTKGTPDIDLLIEDAQSSTLVVAELKWVRKPWSIRDRLSADEQVGKASKQLAAIQYFLQTNPEYLTRTKRVLSQPFASFKNVHYMTVARDHFFWPDLGDYPIVEHGVFKRALQNSSHLQATIIELLQYNWLPVEDRDFVVRYDTGECNGVFVELEGYYPAGQNAADHFTD